MLLISKVISLREKMFFHMGFYKVERGQVWYTTVLEMILEAIVTYYDEQNSMVYYQMLHREYNQELNSFLYLFEVKSH